jgi:hypothetical protein
MKLKKKLKHEPNIVEITHLCIRHGVHTSFLLKEVKSTFAYYMFSSSIQDKLTYFYSSNCCHHFWPGLIAHTAFSECGHLLRLGVKSFTSLESQVPPLTCTMESFVFVMSEEHSRLPLLYSQCQNFRMSYF